MIANAEDFNRHWPTWIGLQSFEKKSREDDRKSPRPSFVIS